MGSARTLSNFCNFSFWVVRVHPTSWDQLGPIPNFYNFLFSLVRVHPTSWDQLGPSQMFTIFLFGWSEFIPPLGGMNSEPSQIFTIFCFRWSEFIPPPGICSDPPKFLQFFTFGGPSSSHLLGPARTPLNFCKFSFLVVRLHPASWDQLVFLPNFCEFARPPNLFLVAVTGRRRPLPSTTGRHVRGGRAALSPRRNVAGTPQSRRTSATSWHNPFWFREEIIFMVCLHQRKSLSGPTGFPAPPQFQVSQILTSSPTESTHRRLTNFLD